MDDREGKDGRSRDGKGGGIRDRLDMGFPRRLGDESLFVVLLGILFVVVFGCCVWYLY